MSGRRRATMRSHVVLCPRHSHDGCTGLRRQRHPEIDGLAGALAQKPARRYSDDGERRRPQAEAAADDRRVASEPTRPVGVTEHGDRLSGRRRIVGRQQRPPDGGGHAQGGEVVPGHPFEVDGLWRTVNRDRVPPHGRGRDRVDQIGRAGHDSAVCRVGKDRDPHRSDRPRRAQSIPPAARPAAGAAGWR